MAHGFVRPARDADAADIARVQLSTWRTAYGRFIPAFAIEKLDAGWLAERWREAITAPPDPRHHVLVAYEQGAETPTVGFAAVGPADESALAPDESGAEPGTGSITDLLVEPRWGRRGHGSRLLAAAVDLWRGDGLTRALAWAYRDDVASQKFLTSTGWEPDGATRALDVDGVLVPQLRLHVSLQPDPVE